MAMRKMMREGREAMQQRLVRVLNKSLVAVEHSLSEMMALETRTQSAFAMLRMINVSHLLQPVAADDNEEPALELPVKARPLLAALDREAGVAGDAARAESEWGERVGGV